MNTRILKQMAIDMLVEATLVVSAFVSIALILGLFWLAIMLAKRNIYCAIIFVAVYFVCISLAIVRSVYAAYKEAAKKCGEELK